jgi:hypothetical protein
LRSGCFVILAAARTGANYYYYKNGHKS